MATENGNPNVILIMLDTQKAENMSVYGYPKPTTPNIEKLAADGVVFEDNISPCIWTLPAMASWMSGKHVHSHGACANNDSIKRENIMPTLPEMLFRSKWYSTAGFFGNVYSQMVTQGFSCVQTPFSRYAKGGPCHHGTNRARTEAAIRWIDAEHFPEHRPFMLFLHLLDPHGPWKPVEPFRSQFLLPDATEEEVSKIGMNVYECYTGEAQYTQRQWDVLKSLYDADTASCDSHVGLLMDYLRQKGILDDSIVMIFGDHGEMFGEHDHFGLHPHFMHHLCMYEPLIRVPLIARFPGGMHGGKRVSTPTQTHDIVPTLAEVIGFEAPQAQGFSLIPAINGQPKRHFTLTEYQKSIHMAMRMLERLPERDPRLYVRWLKCWRQDGMKYVWASDMKDQLFDLKKDPKENNNLIEAMPQKAQEMRLAMERFLATLPHANVDDRFITGKVSPETDGRMRGMEWFLEV